MPGCSARRWLGASRQKERGGMPHVVGVHLDLDRCEQGQLKRVELSGFTSGSASRHASATWRFSFRSLPSYRPESHSCARSGHFRNPDMLSTLLAVEAADFIGVSGAVGVVTPPHFPQLLQVFGFCGARHSALQGFDLDAEPACLRWLAFMLQLLHDTQDPDPADRYSPGRYAARPCVGCNPDPNPIVHPPISPQAHHTTHTR